MKITSRLGCVLVLSGLWLTGNISSALAFNVSEPPDFPNPAATTNYLFNTVGTNTFSGSISGADSQDRFDVTIAQGFKLAGITRNVTGDNTTSGLFLKFFVEESVGFGTGSFTSFPTTGGPWSFLANVNSSSNNFWTVNFVVEANPDYAITHVGGALTVTDLSGNSDTLTVSQPSAGNIKFAAAGRYFSINGANTSTNDSGNISLSGIVSVTINSGGGSDINDIGAFVGTFPSLTIQGGTGNDQVNFNGDITFGADRSLDVDLQNDDASPGTDAVSLASGVNLIASGNGTITVRCSKNVTMNSGSSLEVQDGDLTVEANQQTVPTPGNFAGVSMSAATAKSSGLGYVIVNGRGGDDLSGSQLGLSMSGGAKIIGGTSGYALVLGTAGNSTNWINRGVTLSGTGTAITSVGAGVSVTGTGATNGSFYGIGISLLGGEISAGGVGNVIIAGTGGGANGSGFNQGIEISGPTSHITTSGGNINIDAIAGPGGSSGVYFADSAYMTTPAAGGVMTIYSDSVSIDSTCLIMTTNGASTVQFLPKTFGTPINLGGGDVNTAGALMLGLTDAELDRVSTKKLTIGANDGGITVTSPISLVGVTNLLLLPGIGSVKAPVAGTDISLGGSGVVSMGFGSLNCAITGLAADTGFPQLKVTGQVEIHSFALTLTNTTYAGVLGDTFMLVNNDGADPIVGMFTGLPEGAYVKWPGSPAFNARISYVGGDGNDVVLTLVDALIVRNTASTGVASLRDAVSAAGAIAGANTITFDPTLNAQAIVLADHIEINDTAGVTIDATALNGGFGLSGGGASRMLRNDSGSIASLKGFVFINGNGVGSTGTSYSGGAINNEGTMSINRCTFYNNAVPALGGAILNGSVLTMTNCTLSGNNCSSGGGAIANGGTLTLTHCTVSGNFCSTGSGIYNLGTLTLVNSIVSGNTGTTDIRTDGGTAVYVGANLVGSYAGVSPTGPAAITGAAALAPLGGYGGSTTTMALMLGSLARNAAVGSTATSDQRGYPIVGTPDIGAYEAGTLINYNAWAWESFPTNAAPTDRSRDSDSDRDGRINAIEYATLTSPVVTNAGSALMFACNAAGTRATNAFNYVTNATDVFYQVDRTTNLPPNWTTIFDVRPSTGVSNLYGNGINAILAGSLMTVTDTNISGWPRAYYRLRVTLTP